MELFNISIFRLAVAVVIHFVDRAVLWKTLRSCSVPLFLTQLIEHLHARTTLRIRVCGQQLAEPMQTTSGVRHGCVLAPALFCTAIDWILSRCVDTVTKIMSTTLCSLPTACPSGRTFCKASTKLHIQ